MPEHVVVRSTPEEDRELDRLAELAVQDRDGLAVEAAASRARLQRLGGMMRAAREAEELTLDELAARCGIDKAALSRIENGRANITFGTMERYAAGLGRELSIQILEPA